MMLPENQPKVMHKEEITCPKCGFKQQKDTECFGCGIVFAKINPMRNAPVFNDPEHEKVSGHLESAAIIKAADRWIYRMGKYSIVSIMGLLFFHMVIKRSSWCFLDYVNLPFHEFGHILFIPFGEMVQFIGGTIGQLMWPLILLVYFISKKDPLASSFCLFWFGENFLNISKYIADARSMALPLVGGGIHDWNFLLGKWHMLKHDQTIAKVVFFIGVMLMTASIIWAFLQKPKR